MSVFIDSGLRVFLLGPTWDKRINSSLMNPVISSIQWSQENMTDRQISWLLGFNSIEHDEKVRIFYDCSIIRATLYACVQNYMFVVFCRSVFGGSAQTAGGNPADLDCWRGDSGYEL
jgi:hypothetical protein